MRTTVVRNTSPKPFDNEKQLAAIELIKQGYSCNQTARMLGISNANPVRSYLQKEHPEVYQIALNNGKITKNIYRKGKQ